MIEVLNEEMKVKYEREDAGRKSSDANASVEGESDSLQRND